MRSPNRTPPKASATPATDRITASVVKRPSRFSPKAMIRLDRVKEQLIAWMKRLRSSCSAIR